MWFTHSIQWDQSQKFLFISVLCSTCARESYDITVTNILSGCRGSGHQWSFGRSGRSGNSIMCLAVRHLHSCHLLFPKMRGEISKAKLSFPSLWPSGIGSNSGRSRLWVRCLEVSDIHVYPMFTEITNTWIPSGFSGYIWLDTKSVLKKLPCLTVSVACEFELNPINFSAEVWSEIVSFF